MPLSLATLLRQLNAAERRLLEAYGWRRGVPGEGWRHGELGGPCTQTEAVKRTREALLRASLGLDD